jgi:biotin synthase
MFRLVHPRTDLRVAGGREVTLRALQVMALYPANSIFTQGYLTTGGATPHDDHQMIRDAGFELELASGEAVPADPEAVAHLDPSRTDRFRSAAEQGTESPYGEGPPSGGAARRGSLPVARS